MPYSTPRSWTPKTYFVLSVTPLFCPQLCMCRRQQRQRHLLASLISKHTRLISILRYQQFANSFGACACSSRTVHHEKCFATNASMLPFCSSLDEQLYFFNKNDILLSNFNVAKTLRRPWLYSLSSQKSSFGPLEISIFCIVKSVSRYVLLLSHRVYKVGAQSLICKEWMIIGLATLLVERVFSGRDLPKFIMSQSSSWTRVSANKRGKLTKSKQQLYSDTLR